MDKYKYFIVKIGDEKIEVVSSTTEDYKTAMEWYEAREDRWQCAIYKLATDEILEGIRLYNQKCMLVKACTDLKFESFGIDKLEKILSIAMEEEKALPSGTFETPEEAQWC
jgi:hypothetical protein